MLTINNAKASPLGFVHQLSRHTDRHSKETDPPDPVREVPEAAIARPQLLILLRDADQTLLLDDERCTYEEA